MSEVLLEITPFQQMLSSCIGSATSLILLTPLDVVKIRIQAQQNELMKNNIKIQSNVDNFPKRLYYINGTLDGLLKISKNEGLKTLWSGLSPTLLMTVPTTMMYFTIYHQMKYFLQCQSKVNLDNATSLWIPLLAAGTGRLVAASVMSPLEMIRTKMQSQKLSYREIGIAVNQLIKKEGISKLWIGLNATLLRDVPFSCIYWLNYENFKRIFHQYDYNFGFSFLAGAVSGSIASVVTLPFDVVKTHRQIELGQTVVHRDPQSKRVVNILWNIYLESGFRGWFKGLSPRLIKVAPSCAVMISIYETLKDYFLKYNENNRKNNKINFQSKI